MGRGRRQGRALSFGMFGMRTPDGEQAVQTLLERVDLSLEPDVDLNAVADEVDEGLVLIASLHPEAVSPEVRMLVYRHLRAELAELGIGVSTTPEEL